MKRKKVCRYCGNLNPEGSRFCNKCGRSISKRKIYPDLLEIHKEADLTLLAIHLFGNTDWVPTVEELRNALVKIGRENRQQTFIRVLRLHLPGVQERALLKEIAAERDVSPALISQEFRHISMWVRVELLAARWKNGRG